MATTRENGLIEGLGLIDSTTLVMGSMIGSGVFIVAADISRQVQSPGLMMMTWFVTAALGIPTLDGLGGVGEGAHAVNESILANRIADRTALIAKILAAL